MDKPRICEVLGVEVREEFDFCMFSGLYVDEAGYVRLNEGAIIESTILCLLINEPDSIIRKPRWTEQEVEDAKAVNRVFGRVDTVRRTVDGALVFGDIVLNAQLLPGILPGQSIKLSEICGGAQ